MFRIPKPLLALSLLLAASPALAAVTLSNTRIVFDGHNRDASISVANSTTRPYAVQVWVNTEADDINIAAPFIATPPLFRLDGRKEQMVRIVRTAGQLPDDRESVFYFNAQEIPGNAEGDSNTLKVAIRTRIKFFYRPKGLPGSLLESLPKLQWSVVRAQGKPVLRVNNPSAYHVSFIHIRVGNAGKEEEVDAPLMVAPFSTREYPLPGAVGAAPDTVWFSVINDHGGYTEPARVALSPAR